MSDQESSNRRMHGFERLLTLWVLLCMGAASRWAGSPPGLRGPWMA